MDSTQPLLHLEASLPNRGNLQCLVDGIQLVTELGSLAQALPQRGGHFIPSPLIVLPILQEDLVNHVLESEAPGGPRSQGVGQQAA